MPLRKGITSIVDAIIDQIIEVGFLTEEKTPFDGGFTTMPQHRM